MKYILKNLHEMKRNQPVFLVLIIITVLVTGIMMNFSFGIYHIFREKKLSEIESLKQLDISISQDAKIVKSSLDKCFTQFSENLENLIDMVLVSVEVDDQLSLECRFSVRDGEYALPWNFRENMMKGNLADNYFTQEQEAKGELVALKGTYQKDGPDRKLRIQDKIYEVIGCQSWNPDNPMIPFASLEPNTEICADSGIYMSFARAITKREYEEIEFIFKENLGELVEISPFSGEMEQSRSLYSVIMLISVCIAVTAAINYAILFQYIMLRQEYMLAVYRMCGMRRKQAVGVYLAECLIIITPVYVIGIILFHVLVLPKLERISIFIRAEFSVKIYLLLFGIYLISSVSVMALVIIADIYRKSVVELIRRA